MAGSGQLPKVTERPKGAGRIDELRPSQMAECGLSRREAAKSTFPGSFNGSMQHLPDSGRRVFRGCARFGYAPDRLAGMRTDIGPVVDACHFGTEMSES